MANKKKKHGSSARSSFSRQGRNQPKNEVESETGQSRSEQKKCDASNGRDRDENADSIPFVYQHSLTCRLQRMLEDMCYRFGTKWCPDVMIKEKWTTPSRLELTKWIAFVRKRRADIPPEAFAHVEPATLNQMWSPVASIRHYAVHRLTYDTCSLLQALEAGTVFARFHQDTPVADYVDLLTTSIRSIVERLTLRQLPLLAQRRDLMNSISQLEQRIVEHERQIDDVDRDCRSHAEAAGDSIARLVADPTDDAIPVEKEVVTYGPPEWSGPEKEPELSKTVAWDREKAFPPQGSWQLVKLKHAQQFCCCHCHGDKVSGLVAFAASDLASDQPVCNGCYARLVSDMRQKLQAEAM